MGRSSRASGSRAPGRSSAREASPPPSAAEAPAEQGGARIRVRRKGGLGDLGKLAWQKSLPELSLLPQGGSYRAAELLALYDLRTTDLRRIERALPELAGEGRAGQRRYTRAQVEQIIRARHLLDAGTPLNEIRLRLQEPAPAAALSAPGTPGPELDDDLPALPPSVSSGERAAALPREALALLKEELSAILALCQAPQD